MCWSSSGQSNDNYNKHHGIRKKKNVCFRWIQQKSEGLLLLKLEEGCILFEEFLSFPFLRVMVSNFPFYDLQNNTMLLDKYELMVIL